MKWCFLIILNCLLVSSGFSQKFLRPYDRQLDSLYRLLIAEPESLERQQAFFDLFPANFKDFKRTYGFDPELSGYDLMPKLAYDHLLNGFAKLDKIVDTVYYTRLIDLSIGGLWVAADGIAVFQYDVLWKKAAQKPDLLFYLLSTYPNEKVYSFWYFYFNSLLPSKEGIPACFTALKGKYPEIYRILEKAFKDSDGQATLPYG